MALSTHPPVSAAPSAPTTTPEAAMTMTGPIPTSYSRRHRRPLEVTLTGWQLGITSSSFLAVVAAAVAAWMVRR